MQTGVDLCVVSSHSPHLTHLAISDSRVLCSDAHMSEPFLPRLTSCFLMRVTYSEDSDPVILERAQSLTVLHMEAGPLITDDLIRRLICMAHLGNLGEVTFVKQNIFKTIPFTNYRGTNNKWFL